MVIKGVIKPPPEIRAVADRTASYVAKNGRAFEARILASAKGKTPKFAFLQPNNPFHAYYEDRIQFYENGGVDEKEEQKKEDNGKKPDAKAEGGSADKGKSAEEPSADSKTQNVKSKVMKSVIDPVAKALLTQRNRIKEMKAASKVETTSADADEDPNRAPRVVIPPPEPLHFINIVTPSSLTIVQIETIQLVAQLTALDGKGGTFLQALTRREWNNPMYAFTQPRHGHFAFFSALVDAYRRVINIWTSKEVEKDIVKEMANNPQRCLEIAAYRAEYNRHLLEERRQDDQTPVVQIDWHDFVVVETIDFGKDEQVVTLPPPPPADISPPVARTGKDDDMDESDEEDKEQIRVVPTYQPKIVSANQSTMETVIDPITGQRVRVADMPEHMRIQLLDPKWAEERKKFQDKQKDSNLVGGDVVADNLARLAQARGMSVSGILLRVHFPVFLSISSRFPSQISAYCERIYRSMMSLTQRTTPGRDSKMRIGFYVNKRLIPRQR
jgi:splicing factor 3A subunit 1